MIQRNLNGFTKVWFTIHFSFSLNNLSRIIVEQRAAWIRLYADCSTTPVARKFLINTPRCSRKPRPLRRKWHQREAARVARKRAKKRRRAVTWHRRTTGGYCSRSTHKESTRRDSPRFAKQYGSLLISTRGTLSLSILGSRYPQAGPPGRLTPGKVIFPRVARCFYVAEKIKLGNPGGKEGELCKTLLST